MARQSIGMGVPEYVCLGVEWVSDVRVPEPDPVYVKVGVCFGVIVRMSRHRKPPNGSLAAQNFFVSGPARIVKAAQVQWATGKFNVVDSFTLIELTVKLR